MAVHEGSEREREKRESEVMKMREKKRKKMKVQMEERRMCHQHVCIVHLTDWRMRENQSKLGESKRETGARRSCCGSWGPNASWFLCSWREFSAQQQLGEEGYYLNPTVFWMGSTLNSLQMMSLSIWCLNHSAFPKPLTFRTPCTCPPLWVTALCRFY